MSIFGFIYYRVNVFPDLCHHIPSLGYIALITWAYCLFNNEALNAIPVFATMLYIYSWLIWWVH